MTNTARKTIEAFLNREQLKINNTETNGSDLYLFGNRIAYHKDNDIIISMCGYNTVTTKDRLNELLDKLNHGRIRTKNYVSYYVEDNTSFEIDPSKEYSLNELEVIKNNHRLLNEDRSL